VLPSWFWAWNGSSLEPDFSFAFGFWLLPALPSMPCRRHKVDFLLFFHNKIIIIVIIA